MSKLKLTIGLILSISLIGCSGTNVEVKDTIVNKEDNGLKKESTISDKVDNIIETHEAERNETKDIEETESNEIKDIEETESNEIKDIEETESNETKDIEETEGDEESIVESSIQESKHKLIYKLDDINEVYHLRICEDVDETNMSSTDIDFVATCYRECSKCEPLKITQQLTNIPDFYGNEESNYDYLWEQINYIQTINNGDINIILVGLEELANKGFIRGESISYIGSDGIDAGKCAVVSFEAYDDTFGGIQVKPFNSFMN